MPVMFLKIDIWSENMFEIYEIIQQLTWETTYKMYDTSLRRY